MCSGWEPSGSSLGARNLGHEMSGKVLFEEGGLGKEATSSRLFGRLGHCRFRDVRCSSRSSEVQVRGSSFRIFKGSR